MEFDVYLKDNLGYDYKENDSNLMFNCPFCNDYKHDYKLYFKKANDSSNGIWQCWRCGRKGNPITFVMQYEGVDFKEAVEILELYDVHANELQREQQETGLTAQELIYLKLGEMKSTNRPQPEKEEPLPELKPPPLPVGFKRIIDNLDNPEVKPFVDYLVNKRNIPKENIAIHNIGYVQQGWTPTTSGSQVDLSNHLVFLGHDMNGDYAYWTTRSILPNPYTKSFNGFSTSGQYSKSNTIFNLNRAIQTPYVVLVEGVLDAMTLGQSGVATYGKKVTPDQLKLLKQSIIPQHKIFIMLDTDAKYEAVELAKKIKEFHDNVFIVNNNTNKDPNDMGQYESWKMIRDHALPVTKQNLLLFTLQ